MVHNDQARYRLLTHLKIMSNLGLYYLIYGGATLSGGVLVALILTWVTKYQGGFGWASSAGLQFNWHPFLMVLGLVVLSSQSILIYRTARYQISKKNEKYLHGGMHLIAFICAVIGLQAVFDSHNRGNMANLYSLHSWLGLITVIIFAAQFVFGFIAFLYPGASGPSRKTLMPHHVFVGTITFIMAVITTVSGITELTGWTSEYSSLPPVAYVLNFMGLFAVLYGVLTLYLLLIPAYKRPALQDD